MNNNDVKQVTLALNTEQATKKLHEITTELESVRKLKAEAFEKGNAKAYALYTSEAKKLERQQQRLVSRTQAVEKTLQNMDRATPKDLRNTIREINRQLNSGSIERGSKEWNTLTAAVAKANTELQKIKEEQKAIESNKTLLQKWGNAWQGLVVTIGGIKDALSSAMNTAKQFVEEYAEIQEHTASVTKYTGLAADEVDKLNDSFKQMDTRTPLAKLNDLAADAGRLGIQSREAVQEFVEAADQINTALGEDLGEDAVKNIGKLAQMFGTADSMGLKKGMLSTASVINELAQSSSASEGYLLEFTNRLAGVGHQAGMTQAQIMGLGSVMDQNAVNVEKGATSLQNVLTALFTNPQKLAKTAGLEVKQFTELLRTDANQALLQFLQALQDTGGMDRLAPVLKEMGMSGAGVTQTLSTLAAKLDDVKQAQEQANVAFNEGTSCSKESAMANATLQAQLDMAKQRWANLRTELGQRLTPIYLKAINTALTMGQALRTVGTITKSVAQFFVQHRTAILTTTAAIVTFTVALKAVTLYQKAAAVVTAIQTAAVAAYRTAVASCTAAQIAFNAAIKANGFTAIISAVLSAVAALGTYLFLTRSTTNATKDATKAKQLEADALKQGQQAQEAVNRAKKTAADNAEREKTKIELLNRTLHDGNATYAQRKDALDQLKSIIPGYHAQLTKEGQLERDNVQAINDYINALDAKAEAEALYDELVEQKKKTREARKTLKTKQNNVDRVQNVLDNNFEYADFSAPDDSPYKPKGSGNKKRDQKEAELATQLKARDKAQQEVNESLRTENELQNELLKTRQRLNTLNSGHPAAAGGKASSPAVTSHNSTNANTNTGGDAKRDQIQQIKDRAQLLQVALQAIEQEGLYTHSQAEAERTLITLHAIEQQQQLYEKNTPEWVNLEQQRLNALKQTREASNALTLEQIQAQETLERNEATANYLKGETNEKQYQQQLYNIRLNYLKQRAEAARKEGLNDAAAQYQSQYDEEEQNAALQRQGEFWNKVEQFRQQWLAKSKQEQRTDEEQFAKELHDKGLLSEEEYQKALKEIKDKYTDTPDTSSPLTGSTDAMSAAVINFANVFQQLQDRIKDGEATWQDYAAAGVAAVAMVTATMSSASQLVQANQQLEEARITKRYDTEIKAAGNNTKKTKKLEEQKQAELAKVKTKYNKKAMKIEIAQATAQMATNAIIAYGQGLKVNVFFGPIAAAMALAAGAIQIAAIKKQHQAQAEGYYTGGFTPGRNYTQTAGVVHQGEFVANHQAVNNPAILPVLQLIDQAQRTNTVARLTPADVSRAITAPQATAAASLQTATATQQTAAAAPSLQIINTTTDRQTETLDRLTEQLERGITATVTLDGPNGLDRQYRRYQKLNNV